MHDTCQQSREGVRPVSGSMLGQPSVITAARLILLRPCALRLGRRAKQQKALLRCA